METHVPTCHPSPATARERGEGGGGRGRRGIKDKREEGVSRRKNERNR